jgi:hypothetical protein
MALWLLLLTVLAAALSAMTGLFSAMLCTMRYDVLPPSGMRPEP